ncbi:hypothetical protein CTEN210_14859 [Chaetoceros tenuissimus]|uniref:Uncharacterized protein n=1 Tax=Chaetoceros tenuissimus TaxID=426638 RepID=A0AAD3HCT9_9STRA|nr:hypothetical protein CTEN210_14859 [Chaetoceros tenuissimus]
MEAVNRSYLKGARLVVLLLGLTYIGIVTFLFHSHHHGNITLIDESLYFNEATRKDIPASIIYQQNVHPESPDNGFKTFVESQGLCSLFPSPYFTATQIWHQNLDKIYTASHVPDMQKLTPSYPMSDGTMTDEGKFLYKLLNEIVTAKLLRRGIVHIPSSKQYSLEIVKNLIHKIEARINDPVNAPVVQIVVIGGSVTSGAGCHPDLGQETKRCAWPRRLELLINQFANMDIVKVHNLAVGGTGSEGIGNKMVKYWLYPEELKKDGPDVIVNAYSTNDSLPPENSEDPIMDTFNTIHDTIQDFLRITLTSKPCEVPPLILNVDDYLGPQQDAIMGELSYNTAVTRLAKWYDTMFVSYADVVRDLNYADRGDRTFAHWRHVHFGRWAHQMIAWTIGFGTLDLFSNYCADEYHAKTMKNHDLKEQKKKLKKKPNADELMPPPLTNHLSLKNITNVIQLQEPVIERQSEACKLNSKDHKNPCPIAWVSSPGLFTADDIRTFMRKHAVSKTNWALESDHTNGGFQSKDGWIPTNPSNASFTLAFEPFEKDIKTVTVTRLVSYGTKWENSKVRVTLSANMEKKETSTVEENDMKVIAQVEISGSHNMPYSLTLPHTVTLENAIPRGSKIKMQVDLVGGRTYKILGLSFCSH